jgi:beta-glucuronidase
VNSRYLGQRSWRASAEAMLQNNILANENHPSVAVWSIGNELETPPPAAEAGYISAAVNLAHKLDPTRPVTMALSNWPGVGCQAAYAPLDVIGVNEYIGWYDAGGGTTDDRDALGPWLDGLRACYPSKALIVSEFGFEANRHGPVDERGTYEFQSDAIAYHLAVFASTPWLSGALYFPIQDFAVRPGWSGGNPWPSAPFLGKGVYDVFGATKPAYQVLAESFHGAAQIAPAPTTADKRKPRSQPTARTPGL